MATVEESTPAPLVARKENEKMTKMEIQKQRLQKRKEFRQQRRKKQQKEMAGEEAVGMIEGETEIVTLLGYGIMPKLSSYLN